MTNWHDYLKKDPAIANDELCATGTRIPASLILANLGDGLSTNEILRQYPSLKAEHIEATLAYAAESNEEK